MTTIHLDHAGGRTPIHAGRRLLSRSALWQEYLTGRVLVVTDETVAGLYLDRVTSVLADHEHTSVVLPAGETAKTVANWQLVLDALADHGAQRDATVIALGGGVIGDLAGFAAATYMRGIRIIQAPTTLLAQVDAAVGGKTGVNHSAGKNLIGAFHQPAAVIADVDTLATLDARDYRAGLAEVVKYGAIRDPAFFTWLESHAADLNRREPAILAQTVARSVAHKAEVVMADEREAGERALLNFGHTFGHALETATAYERYRHGEAVAIGMALAARLSVTTRGLDAKAADRLVRLLETLGLPVTPPEDVKASELIELMALDKKNRAGEIHLVLLDELGRARVVGDTPIKALKEILKW